MKHKKLCTLVKVTLGLTTIVSERRPGKSLMVDSCASSIHLLILALSRGYRNGASGVQKSIVEWLESSRSSMTLGSSECEISTLCAYWINKNRSKNVWSHDDDLRPTSGATLSISCHEDGRIGRVSLLARHWNLCIGPSTVYNVH